MDINIKLQNFTGFTYNCLDNAGVLISSITGKNKILFLHGCATGLYSIFICMVMILSYN